MARKLVSEFIIPAEWGRGCKIKKGQTIRLIAIEGPIVADVAFLNAHDYRETYDAPNSYNLNMRMGTGNGYYMRYLLSRLPKANVMAEITDDKVAKHWVICGGHCSPFSNRSRQLPPSYRSCWGNIAEVLDEYGIIPDDVPDTFPLWMNVEPSGDSHVVRPATSKKGDYIDFLAHMDLLVAISSCPGNYPDAIPYINLNDGANRPIKAEIWEES